MHIKVHLRKLKKALSAAVKVAKFEQIDGHGDFVELQVIRGSLSVSSYGGGIDVFSTKIDLQDQFPNSDVVRLALPDAMHLSKTKVKSGKKNQDETVELETLPEGRSLRYTTQTISGIVQIDHRSALIPVFQKQDQESESPYKMRSVVSFPDVGKFKRALLLALEIQGGWLAADRPLDADYVWFQVCGTTDMVDELIGYASGNVVAVYSSDHQRMFATYLPAVAAIPRGQGSELFPVEYSTEYVQIDNASAMNRVFSIETKVAKVLSSVLPDSGMMKLVAAVDQEKRVIAWKLYNNDTILRFRDAMAQPEADFERFSASIVPDVVIEHTPTKDLGSVLSTIAKCDPTIDHGMTIRFANGETLFSSPEGKRPYKHVKVAANSSIPAEAEMYFIADGAGIASMVTLSAKHGSGESLVLQMNNDTLVIKDQENHACAVFLKYAPSEA